MHTCTLRTYRDMYAYNTHTMRAQMLEEEEEAKHRESDRAEQVQCVSLSLSLCMCVFVCVRACVPVIRVPN